MKWDAPAAATPIDRGLVVGRPRAGCEGPAKVTGTAPYAYERHDVAPHAAYGSVVGSAIAKGRITRLDTRAAETGPGVIAVVTHENAGRLGKADANTATLLAGPK